MRSTLEDYRQEINQIDEELYALYKKRLNVSRKVGAYKKEHNLPILDAKREGVIALSLQERYRDDIDLNAYLDLHETMMRVSRNAQYTVTPQTYHFIDSLRGDCLVGYQGNPGSFLSIATNLCFPDGMKKMFATFTEVFAAVERGEIFYGVVSLENSIDGEIVEVFDLVGEYAVAIVAEIIQQSESCKNNSTRAIVIAKQEQFLRNAEKTSIRVTIDHNNRTLDQVVAQIRYEQVRVLKISSRPMSNTDGCYQFFIDFEGTICDERVQRLLQRLQAEGYEMRLLGSYPIFISHLGE